MTEIRYNSEELAAFSLADKLADGNKISNDEIVKILLAVTHQSYQARKHLDKAIWGLIEKSKAKRENIKKIIEMEKQ